MYFKTIFSIRKNALKTLLSIITVFTLFSVNAQKISYIHQNKTLQEIEDPAIEWKNYTEPIYEGLNNGIYWFKIDLESNEPHILHIPESHITRAQLYHQNKEIVKEENTRYIKYKINNSKSTNKKYYLKVNCLLEGRIPLKIDTIDNFYKNEIKQFNIISIYFGIVISVLILNIFLYFSLKEVIYLYYSCMAIAMSSIAFYKDGLSALVLGMNGINETIETMCAGLLLFTCIHFATKFMSLKQYLPKLRMATIVIATAGLICNIIFQFTHGFHLYIIIYLIYLLSFDLFWLCSILLWNKTIYARFFALGYGIPLLFGHDYFISPHLGIHVLDLPLYVYKIGSISEMIIFIYALTYKSKKITEENRGIRKKLIEYTNKLKKQNLDINIGNSVTDELIAKLGFTIREIEILKKISLKKTNKEIALELFISENTVKFHIRNILQKLEVKNRKQASKKYFEFMK